MAEDGYLPKFLTGKHRHFGTPWIGIVVSGVVYGLLALHSLPQLIAVYNWLRSATTVITVAAAWQLRRKRPDLPRSFVVPGGTPGLIAAVVAVVVMTGVALTFSDRYGVRWGPTVMALGPAIYLGLWLARRRRDTLRQA
jgi:amino acid transporter